MRLRTSLGLAAAVTAGLVQTSSAFVRPKGAEPPIVSAERGPRTHRATTYGTVAGFTAIVDHDTNVPLRMWGQGQLVAGVVADAAVAEAAARQLLAQHLATLAPGAAVSDFELVSNVVKRGVRSVGFIQRASGIRVLGGTIGFAFKADRLVMISSTALPNISVAPPAMQLPLHVIGAKATAWLADSGKTTRARLTSSFAPTTERVIVPVVRPRLGPNPDITYRVAEHVALDAIDDAGAWDVWVDAIDGSPIARKSTLRYATGKVLFDAADRYPGGARGGKPAAFATHTVNGAGVTSTADGSITWAGTANASVALTLAGPFVVITNKAGTRLTETTSLAPNGTFTWSRAATEMEDAQINAFVHANTAKAFAKAKIDPEMAWLDQPLSVTVNENQTCNAFSTGDDIHFFRKGSQCENTGRMADVVYHEFGHSLHAHAIIDGVGAFDGALSEGMSDVYAALITRDHGMGRGFFFTNAPLRDLDNNKKWPANVTGEVHDDGEIIGGAMWHLGEALEAKLGATAGYEKTIEIFHGIISRASDIPSAYAEALLADDTDGDLTNGTPNQCEISAAFGRHGLANPALTLGIQNPVRDDFHIAVATNPSAASACPGATISSAMVEWRARGGAVASVPLALAGNTYAGDIPTQPEGTVVQYKVTLSLSDGSTVSYPNNDADPFYEFYVGPVTNIKCFDFEAGAADWTHGANQASRDEWEAGAPMGLGGDPKTAHGGTQVFGLDLSRDGVYYPRSTIFAETPEIDVTGHQHVRLQYWRWLGVEDGFYDKARITVNGTEVWKNFTSASEPRSGVSHIDREWRFQDIDLKDVAAAGGGKIKIKFEIISDPGLELSGWTLDDVCVVALTGAAVTCGNAMTDDGETCDDGNRVDGDGCSANCQDESPSDEAGCCSVGGGPEGALALSLLTLGMLFRRRRR